VGTGWPRSTKGGVTAPLASRLAGTSDDAAFGLAFGLIALFPVALAARAVASGMDEDPSEFSVLFSDSAAGCWG
jgi:hypothetical protein